MAMKFTLFPQMPVAPGKRANPYVADFRAALEAAGHTVVNPPHRNPLLSLLRRGNLGDVVVFNWFESIPEFRHGVIQSWVAVGLLLWLRLRGRRVVWMLHNKAPHAPRHPWLNRLLRGLIARWSSLIVTHARAGLDVVREHYPEALAKAHFLDHPTKNRLGLVPDGVAKDYDLLIWGHVARYKGVFEFVDYLRAHPGTGLRTCIVGTCSPPSLFEELKAACPPGVTAIHESPSFEALARYVARAHFVLVPYHTESVLSSGILMDSLSYGAAVIGPEAGSFDDYAAEPALRVCTFRTFDDIPALVAAHRGADADRAATARFLDGHDWPHFVQRLTALLSDKS